MSPPGGLRISTMNAIPRLDTFSDYLRHWAELEPDLAAFSFEDISVSYAELEQRSDQCARAFLDLGIARGDRVATILPPGPECVVTFAAANKIGAILVPLDVRFRSADLRRFIGAAEPGVLVAAHGPDEEAITDRLRDSQDLLETTTVLTLEPSDLGPRFDDLVGNAGKSSVDLTGALDQRRAEDGALIIFTGGSTGVPKAALLSQANVTATCRTQAESLARMLVEQGHEGQVRVLGNLPPSHIGGALELIAAPLVAGWEVVLQEKWSPYPVLEAIVERQIPICGAVPTMYAILLSLPDLDRFDLSCLKIVFLSGEKVALELLRGVHDRICRQVVVGYGSTEAGAEVTFTEPGDALELLASGYVGKPQQGVHIAIVDENDEPLPPGQIGEVLVGGALTIPGYFRMPEEDAVGFTEDGMCRTGDLGHLTESGALVIQGRKKQIIRVGSYTVLASEVEEVALTHPDVAVAAALGVPHEIYGEVVWLVVTPVEGREIGVDAVRELCETQLADFKVPRHIEVRERMPMSRIGKIDRMRLKTALLERQ